MFRGERELRTPVSGNGVEEIRLSPVGILDSIRYDVGAPIILPLISSIIGNKSFACVNKQLNI